MPNKLSEALKGSERKRLSVKVTATAAFKYALIGLTVYCSVVDIRKVVLSVTAQKDLLTLLHHLKLPSAQPHQRPTHFSMLMLINEQLTEAANLW
jgi:hypothetical protein